MWWKNWKTDLTSVDSHDFYIEKKPITIHQLASCRMNDYFIGPNSGWNEPTSTRFKCGPPSRPNKPRVVVEPATQVAHLTVKKSLEQMERGSEETWCEVQCMEVCESNENKHSWESRMYPLKNQSVDTVHVFSIDWLKQNNIYKVRVRMVNSCGISDTSETCEFNTRSLIPGTPQNVRLSSKRTSDCLKVCWDPPNHNPEGIHRYKVQYKRSRDSLWIMSGLTSSSKHSRRTSNLKSDTFYDFRVQALNCKSEESDWSDPVQGETRFGTLVVSLSTAGAAIGGAVFSPIGGSVGLGVVAANLAEKKKSGKKHTALAAVGGGIGGALLGYAGGPFTGILSGVVVNKILRGKLSYVSPQTSDDEED